MPQTSAFCKPRLRAMIICSLIACLAGLSTGCHRDAGEPSASPEIHNRVDPKSSSHGIESLADLLTQWKELDDTMLCSVMSDLSSESEPPHEQLRLFTLSEEDFLSLDEQEIHVQQQEHMENGTQLLELTTHLIQIAQSLDEAGESEKAAALCQQIRTYGHANSSATLSRLARSFGNAVITLVKDRCPE